MKLKIRDICIRVVSEKPYKDVRLPIAPCLLIKCQKIAAKKMLADKMAKKDAPKGVGVNKAGTTTTNNNNNTAEDAQDAHFYTTNQDYDVTIAGISMHMMSNYELKPDEYSDMDAANNKVNSEEGNNSTTVPKVFPFSYPDQSHPSTFFVCASECDYSKF